MTEWAKRDRKVPAQSLYLVLAMSWLAVTLAFAIWWLIHGLSQIKTLADLDPQLEMKVAVQHRMILGEGLTLIALLVVGGVCLVLLLVREARRNQQMKAFFATFTHELKTPLASLRLQAEALQEDFEERASEATKASSGRLVDRLLQDASRLELQLDNALFLATARLSDQIHLESISVLSVLDRLRSSFPDFELLLDRDVFVQADRRAMESIVKNLIQNARIHGRATSMEIHAEAASEGTVRLRFTDNGEGFRGQADAVGRLFFRHTSRSGSGIGLHLSKILAERMCGELRVHLGERAAAGKDGRRFVVEILFPEGRKA